jgi:hypothetical protein
MDGNAPHFIVFVIDSPLNTCLNATETVYRECMMNWLRHHIKIVFQDIESFQLSGLEELLFDWDAEEGLDSDDSLRLPCHPFQPLMNSLYNYCQLLLLHVSYNLEKARIRNFYWKCGLYVIKVDAFKGSCSVHIWHCIQGLFEKA